ncbi:Hypothetical_protein [Hexamita inflata]|uniref:Hypothetical_protein n=1 Tax=Hexamita inflata TaxID=28002 RepID=A0AA86RFR6_9EUKA|nr:Hypothetical protein HINF_LOCUS59737 [Hexamita inflata]
MHNCILRIYIKKKRRLTKRSLKTLRSIKRKSSQSKSHKIKRPLKSPNLAKSQESQVRYQRLNPRKQLIHPQQYTPKLGICKNKQTKTQPRNLIKFMKRCIKGNHHQAMPIQRNNLSCKPKEITSEKTRK